MRFLRRARDGQDKALLGRRGERFAARWLKRRGFRILHRNYRVGDDEADLIALDSDRETVVIVEVKTRRDVSIPGESSINHKKRYRMARLASKLQASGPFANRPMRLDAIVIHWPQDGEPKLTHYPNAFESPI